MTISIKANLSKYDNLANKHLDVIDVDMKETKVVPDCHRNPTLRNYLIN